MTQEKVSERPANEQCPLICRAAAGHRHANTQTAEHTDTLREPVPASACPLWAEGHLSLQNSLARPFLQRRLAKLWGKNFGKVACLQSMKDIAQQGKRIIFSVWAQSVLGSLLHPLCRTVPGPSLQILSDFEAHKTKTKRVPKKKRKRCWVLGFHYWILTGIRREICQAWPSTGTCTVS